MAQNNYFLPLFSIYACVFHYFARKYAVTMTTRGFCAADQQAAKGRHIYIHSASQTSQACGLVKGILPGVYIVPSEFCRLSYITYKNLSYCVRLSTRFYG